METDFKKHYDILEVHDRVDWPTLQNTYRKLVNQWHPDRCRHTLGKQGEQTPDEQSAELRFIELTKSYNALRDYYRENHKLPNIKKSYKYHEPELVDTVYMDVDEKADHWNSGRQKSREEKAIDKNTLRKLGLAGATILLLVFSLGVLVALDSNAKSKAIERARSVISASEPSPFNVSAAELRRANAKGSFLLADPLSKPLANQSKSSVLP